MTKKTINIHFGALAPSLSKQLKTQGFLFNKDIVSHFQKDVEAINRVRIRGLINEATSNKSYDKLLKKIMTHISKTEKEKTNK